MRANSRCTEIGEEREPPRLCDERALVVPLRVAKKDPAEQSKLDHESR